MFKHPRSKVKVTTRSSLLNTTSCVYNVVLSIYTFEEWITLKVYYVDAND